LPVELEGNVGELNGPDRAGRGDAGPDSFLAGAGETPPGSLEGELAAELAAADSGLAFIYACLDTLMGRWALVDAMVVLDDPATGRQAFRAGRLVAEGDWAGPLAQSPPGLYTRPEEAGQAAERAMVTDLCQVALRLDLLRYSASHDSLTALFNRRSFELLLTQAVERYRRYGWAFSLALIDLDQFKALNDRYGHHAGDLVLRAVGAEMRRVVRHGDVAARIGGDEFALILPVTDPETVPGLLERLRASVVEHHDFTVEFSVGVASCPGDGEEAAVIRRLADERLYKAKAR
jgi:diguanylate cyclase (GGDEF)-like protein